MKTNIISKGVIKDLINRLDEDGNYRFELLIAIILYEGIKGENIKNISRDQLYNIPSTKYKEDFDEFRVIHKRCLPYLEKFVDKQKIFPYTNQYINFRLREIRQNYLDISITSFSMSDIRTSFAFDEYNRRKHGQGLNYKQCLREVKDLMGHKNLGDTARFLGLNLKELEEHDKSESPQGQVNI